MQRTFLAAIGLAMLLPVAAPAQQAAACRDLDPTARDDAFRAFDCIGALSARLAAALTRLETLEAGLADLARAVGPPDLRLVASDGSRLDPNAVPAVGAHPRTRAVVAYTSDTGEKSCPTGWSPFEAARDRFVVGAGGMFPVVGETGGRRELSLGPSNLPAHTHAYSDGAWDEDSRPPTDASLGGGNWGFSTSDRARITQPAGREAPLPLDITPPYLALYFCVKG